MTKTRLGGWQPVTVDVLVMVVEVVLVVRVVVLVRVVEVLGLVVLKRPSLVLEVLVTVVELVVSVVVVVPMHSGHWTQIDHVQAIFKSSR